MLDIDAIREKISKAEGMKLATTSELKDAEKKYEKMLTTEKALDKVRNILQRAAQLCQQNIEAFLSDIVTEALSAVYGPGAYEFKVQYVPRNNTMECDLLFVGEDEVERDPLDSCGLGAADIASTALRIAYLQLEQGSPFLMIDEPARQLDAWRKPFFADFLKSACTELGLQMIVITHDKESIAPAADRRFNVKMVDHKQRISKVEVIDGDHGEKVAEQR